MLLCTCRRRGEDALLLLARKEVGGGRVTGISDLIDYVPILILVTSSFLFLVVMPGAPSSVLATALCY